MDRYTGRARKWSGAANAIDAGLGVHMKRSGSNDIRTVFFAARENGFSAVETGISAVKNGFPAGEIRIPVGETGISAGENGKRTVAADALNNGLELV